MADMKAEKQYKSLYTPLDSSKREIRILGFVNKPLEKKRERHDPVSLTLSAISLDDSGHPPFSALSYVWGKPVHNHHVTVDEVQMAVTDNLHLALHHLHGSRAEENWWIDALCIDQANLDERGSQVQMMSDIFGSAAITVAHIDFSVFKPKPQVSMSLLTTMAKLRGKREALEWLTKVRRDPDFDERWTELYLLFENAYWRRVWILQELIVSRNLEFFNPDGPCLDSTTFAQALQIFEDITPLKLKLGLQISHQIRPIYEDLKFRAMYWENRTPQPQGLRQMIMNSLRLQATDPRDHLFALLSFTEDGPEVIGRAAYESAPSHIFAGFVQRYYHKYQSLELILLGGCKRKLIDLPSWAPDLSAYETHVKGNIMIHEKIQEKNFPITLVVQSLLLAAPFPSSPVSFSDDNRTLTVTSVQMGEITGLGGYTKGFVARTIRSAMGVRQLDSTHAKHSELSSSSLDRNVLFKNLAQILTLGNLPEISGTIPPTLLGQALTVLLHHAEEPHESEKRRQLGVSTLSGWWDLNKYLSIDNKTLLSWLLGDNLTLEEREDEFVRMFRTTVLKYEDTVIEDAFVFLKRVHLRILFDTEVVQRVIVYTQDGELGSGPAYCNLGDEIWMLYGCKIPMILRPLPDMNGFEVVGECVMYDFMAKEMPVLARESERCTIR